MSTASRPPEGFLFEPSKDILITDEQLLDFFGLALNQKALAIDVESNGKKWWDFSRYDIAGYSISFPGRNVFVPVNMERYSPLQQNSNYSLNKVLLQRLVNSNVTLIGANEKFDWHVFNRCFGLDFSKAKKICDVLLGLHLIEPNSQHGVKTFGTQLIGPNAGFYEQVLHQTLSAMGIRKKDDDYYDYRRAPLAILAPYAACDTWLTWVIYEYILRHKFLGPNIEYLKLEHEVQRNLFVTEELGIKADVEYLGQFKEELSDSIPFMQAKVYRAAGEVFNLESNDQLKNILYDKLELPIQYKKTKVKTADGQGWQKEERITTDKSALFALQELHEIVPWIQKYRIESKIEEYVDKILANLDSSKRIHTTFNQFKEDEAKLSTGRLSSSDPINFENIPTHDTRIRRVFIADNEFILLDFSGEEVRIYTHYSKEPTLVRAYAIGEDVHSRTTEAVFNIPYNEVFSTYKTDREMYNRRDFSKKFLFGDFYGSGLERKAEQMAAAGYGYSVQRARELKANLLKNYPGIKATMRALEDQYKRQGYIEDIFGRRYIPRGEDLLYTLLNYMIQGTGAGILKHAYVNICREFSPNIFANLIHDEGIFDRLNSRRDVLKLKEIAEDFNDKLSVPMITELSYAKPSWQNKIEVPNKFFDQWLDGADLTDNEGKVELAA